MRNAHPGPRHVMGEALLRRDGEGEGSRTQNYWEIGGRAFFAAILCAMMVTVAVADAAKKPPVPVGVDPGGVAVALIGEGVDYTRPEIAKRLARDGEGEIIGWDFVDGDRRPYRADGSRAFEVIAGEASAARMTVFRTASGDNRLSFANAIAMVWVGPARIVLMGGERTEAGAAEPDRELLSAAGEHFSDLLFVAPAGEGAVGGPEPVDLKAIANVVIVAATEAAEGTAGADLAASGKLGNNATASAVAAARIAALAARIAASEPGIKAAELKQRIVALAKPFPDGVAKVARHGWIEDPAGVAVGK